MFNGKLRLGPSDQVDPLLREIVNDSHKVPQGPTMSHDDVLLFSKYLETWMILCGTLAHDVPRRSSSAMILQGPTAILFCDAPAMSHVDSLKTTVFCSLDVILRRFFLFFSWYLKASDGFLSTELRFLVSTCICKILFFILSFLLFFNFLILFLFLTFLNIYFSSFLLSLHSFIFFRFYVSFFNFVSFLWYFSSFFFFFFAFVNAYLAK